MRNDEKVLHLIKRHSAKCDEALRKKGLEPGEMCVCKKCSCGCYVEGNHPVTGGFIRQALHTTSWDAAEDLKRELETRNPAVLVVQHMRKQTSDQAVDKVIEDSQAAPAAITVTRSA